MRLFSINRIRFFRNSGIQKGNGGKSFGIHFGFIQRLEDFPCRESMQDNLRELYIRRFESSHKAVVGMIDSNIAHISWIAEDQLRIDELGFNWRLPDNFFCVYDVQTYPEYRGSGIYPNALLWIVSELKQVFKEAQVWIYCDETNTASEHGIKKADFQFEGSLLSYRILKHVICLSGKVNGVNS